MSARVNIELEAWTDPRFSTLARILGLADRDHALILCAKIWAWQTERYTPDKPTYVVSADMIDGVLGAGGAAALVRSELAEELPEGFRIRGSHGRIEWLHRNRKNGRKGAGKRRPADDQLAPARHPPGDRRPTAPAAGDPLDLGSVSGSEIPDLTHTRVRARDPGAKPGPGHPERGRVANAIWTHATITHGSLHAARIDPHTPPWHAMPSYDDLGWRRLLERCDEMLSSGLSAADAIAIGKRRLECAAVEARHNASMFHFVAAQLFERESFAVWSARSPEQVEQQLARRSRAGPRGSDPRIGRTEPMKPEDYGETGDREL